MCTYQDAPTYADPTNDLGHALECECSACRPDLAELCDAPSLSADEVDASFLAYMADRAAGESDAADRAAWTPRTADDCDEEEGIPYSGKGPVFAPALELPLAA